VRLEAPRPQALFSSQYLCGSSQPDTIHVIHEISVQDNWTRVKALIDCGATSIFASPKLIEILGLQTQQAHTTIYGLDGNVMSHAKDSRKTRLSVSYYEHEQPVDESEVLIVRMTAYDLVLGLPWFKAGNPEIDWETGKLLSLQRR
jgi:predicted aspartyl protease